MCPPHTGINKYIQLKINKKNLKKIKEWYTIVLVFIFRQLPSSPSPLSFLIAAHIPEADLKITEWLMLALNC